MTAQDSFSANDVTLVGEPFRYMAKWLFSDDGELVAFHANGVFEKVRLSDGSTFMAAGRVDVLAAARVEAGRTQADVAEKAGLSARVVQRADQGQRRVNLGEAAAIARAIGRSLEELVQVSADATFETPAMGRPRRSAKN